MERVANKMSFLDFLVQIDKLSATDISAISSLSTQGQMEAIEKKGIDMNWLTSTYEQFQSIEYIDLTHYEGSAQKKNLQPLDEEESRRHGVIILDQQDDQLRLGMINPFDQYIVELFSARYNCFVQPVLIDRHGLRAIFSSGQYIQDDAIDQMALTLGSEIDADSSVIQDHSIDEAELASNTTVKLIHQLIIDAHHHGVSDIHIELEGSKLAIRRRIDGTLHRHELKPHHIAGHLFRRLRIMANLDITQTLIPQDGRICVTSYDKIINCRLSIVATNEGTSAVIRLLGDSQSYASLNRVIDDQVILGSIRDFLGRHAGMMLVTGPTGSGKTTTQYCALMEINKAYKKIISLEDPVEANLNGINQIQINDDLGLSYAKMLTSILRQDPDAIMVGEIRDQETANIAMRAAITGHLVLATLHTSDVMTTINRLMNLEIDGYMVASALRLIVSQRLVKKICRHCKEPHILSDTEMAKLQQTSIDNERIEKSKFYRGKGCDFCQMTGYHDRAAIIEYLVCDDHILDVLSSGDFVGFKLLAEEKIKGKTLFDQAFALFEKGEIPFEETIMFYGE